MKKLIYACLLLFVVSSCTINEHDMPGPMGPPGPPGNANVISTEHITLNTWRYSNQFNWYSADINVPEISADIADFGLVMVYQRIANGPNPVWIPLPDTYGNVTTNFDFYRGGVTVYSFNVDNTLPIAPTGMVVRIVVIPDSFRKANPDANWQNYEATKEILKLQD
ncbi:hypothetical protein [Adhaeribacter terreus]|uniref:Collagen-like protein n=1 Tax=Adhaeribacter terreus TaxID=529703 RepID=A0ABW0EBR8_9BACT